MIFPSALVFSAGLLLLAANAVYAEDRHASYYYPAVQSEETYQAPLQAITGVNRRSRIGFVTQLDILQKKRSYAPTYHMYAKGGQAEKLIIVSTGKNQYATLFQIRGLLASMTADARTSPLFSKLGHVENLNFFDLLSLAGFEQLTVSNGVDLSHRVNIK